MRDDLDFLLELINSELHQQTAVERVVSFRRSGTCVDLLVIFGDSSDAQAIDSLFLAHVRERQWANGDVMWNLSTDMCFVGTETIPVQADTGIRQTVSAECSDLFAQCRGRRAALVRLRDAGLPADADRIVTAIVEKTWFGARVVPPRLRSRVIELTVGLQDRVVRWREGSFGCAYAFGGMSYSLARDSAIDGASIVVRQSWGVDGPRHCSSDRIMAAVNFDRKEHWGIEAGCGFSVEAVGDDVGVHEDQWLQSIASVVEAAGFIRNAYEDRFKAQAESLVTSLEKRREAAVCARRVICGSDSLGREPRCEIELIMLAARMEHLIASKLRAFSILEHTKKYGIDAVISVSMDHQTPVKTCMAEFEFQLANFFLHRHPFKMTDFVICWQLGDVESAMLMHGLTLGGRGWIRHLHLSTHVITVLVLSEFPGLQLASA